MIEIFEGRLGGGKTYSAVQRCIGHLAKGGHVFTNVELNVDAIGAYMEAEGFIGYSPEQIHFITSEEISRFYEVTPVGDKSLPVLVIVDEAHIWLDQRAFNKKELDQLFFFLTQSRKQSTDVIFISQNKKNLDARISRLVQYVWTFRDMRKWRMPFFYFKWPFPHLVQNCWDYDGKTLLLKKWLVWDKAIYKLYNTDAMLSQVARAGVVQNKKVTRVNPVRLFITKHMRILILLVPLMIGLGLWKALPLWQQFHGARVSKAAASLPASATAVSSAPAEIHEEVLKSEPGWWQIGHGPVHSNPLTTEAGEYTVGGPCVYGIVERVEARIAYIRGWDGRRVIVRAVQANTSPTPATTVERRP